MGFEPTVPVDTAVFETARFGRSRTLPPAILQEIGGRSFWLLACVDMNEPKDELFMGQALAAAESASDHDDVPVGAVVVLDGVVIGVGENRRESDQDPTAHAEIVAIREAVKTLPNWRLDGATVYVTLEPCLMCAGALLAARVSRVVIGATDEKAGAVGSRYNVLSDPRLLHEIEVTYGVMAKEASQQLSSFFEARR